MDYEFTIWAIDPIGFKQYIEKYQKDIKDIIDNIIGDNND